MGSKKTPANWKSQHKNHGNSQKTTKAFCITNIFLEAHGVESKQKYVLTRPMLSTYFFSTFQ